MKTTNPKSRIILVVDDDSSICDFFKALLSREGFNIVTARNGNAALALMKTDKGEKMDLIILDLLMPQFGGYELLRELQEFRLEKIPIFIVTAKALDQGTVEMLKAESNVRGFWQKPIEIHEFSSEVHQILGTVSARAK